MFVAVEFRSVSIGPIRHCRYQSIHAYPITHRISKNTKIYLQVTYVPNNRTNTLKNYPVSVCMIDNIKL